MSLIAQLKIPGATGGIPLPSNVPEALRPSPGADVFETVGGGSIGFWLNWMIVIGGMIAVVMFMWGGVEWISSRGDPVRLAEAKKRILYSMIGAAVMVLAFVIVRAVVGILGANNGSIRF